MAKVTVTFEDVEDGKVMLSAAFDPPLDTSTTHLTSAQSAAIVAIEEITATKAKEGTVLHGQN